MGVITKIRNHGMLVMIVVGGALVLFLLGDLFSAKYNIFNRPDTAVARINGKEISQKEFELRVEQEISMNAQKGAQVTEEERKNVRNRLWQVLIQEEVMYPQYDKAGIGFCNQELIEQVVGPNPSDVVINYFTNPQTGRVFEQFADQAGKLDGNKVRQFLQQLSTSEDASSWYAVERAVKMSLLQNKYFTAIKKGLHTTNSEAGISYVEDNRKAKFEYIMKPYSEIPDSTIDVTESEIDAYFKEHKWKGIYQQKEEMRSIDYVMFDVEPSKEDIDELNGQSSHLKEEWQVTEDDSVFVQAYSDGFDVNWYSERLNPTEQRPFLPEMDSLVFSTDTNALFGPFRYKPNPTENGSFRLVKVLKHKMLADSVDARHILLAFPKDGAKSADSARILARADSLIAVITTQNNFEEMVRKFSDDPGSATAEHPGSYGWITQQTNFVKPFKDAAFNGKIGAIQKVWTNYGMHLIQVTKRTAEKPQALVAVVDVPIVPGKETFDGAYREAVKFSQSHKTDATFHAAEDMDIRTAGGIKEGDKQLAGLDNPERLVRWVYRAEKGQVSDPFELGEKFVVACLKEIWQKGTLDPEITKVHDDCEQEVRREKKFEKLKADLEGSSSFEELAAKLQLTPQPVDELAFSSYSVPNAGGERELIGYVFSLQAGQVSVPIKGRNGAYVVHIDSFEEAPEAADYGEVIQRLNQQLGSRVDYEVYQVLQDAAHIEDNRGRFY